MSFIFESKIGLKLQLDTNVISGIRELRGEQMQQSKTLRGEGTESGGSCYKMAEVPKKISGSSAFVFGQL